MKELTEYRANLIDRLVAAAHEFRAGCLAAGNPLAPLEPGGWNIQQVAAHTRDVASLVYGSRVRRTAAEQNPEFDNFDGKTHMASHYSKDEPLEKILDELVEQVESLAGMLREMPVQAWSRESSHVMLGHGLTLQNWVEKDLAHIEEHLATVRRPSQTMQ